MSEYFYAFSEDGYKFKLHRDQSWEREIPEVGESKIDFRNCPWGASVSDVKLAQEGEPLHETTDWLLYEVAVAGFPVNASFHFVNNKFHTGLYHFKPEHADKNTFLSDFDDVLKLLSTKYGPPKTSNEYWTNDLYRDDWNERGLAISCGHYSRFATWEDSESALTFQISGDNFEIKIVAIYKSKNFEAVANQAHTNKRLIGL